MKKTISLSLLLVLAACSNSPEASLEQAEKAYAANDFATARITIAAYLTANPADRDALLLQARTLLALGDGDGAQAALEKLTKGQSASGELAELSAEAALLRGVPDVALTLLGQSKTAEAERLRALAALQKNDRKTAQTHFEASIAAGGSARTFADYARFHLIAGAVADAEAMAAKAAEVDPNAIDTLLVQGQMAVRRGDLNKALGHYARAGKLYPVSLAALTGQAAVLGDLGRFDEMQPVIDRAAALAPKNPTVVFLRARAAAGRKDWAGVRTLLQPIEAGIGQADPLRVIYGEALLRIGEEEQAIAQLRPVLRAFPGHRDAAILLAEAMLTGGDARGALDVLKPFADHPAARNEELALAAKAAKAAGDPAAQRYAQRASQPAVEAAGRDLVYADAAMRAGNWAGAAEAYQRILDRTDGRNPLVLNNMAFAQLMLGNHPAANAFADRALKEAPNNPSVLDTAGWVRFKTGGDKAKARDLLRRAAGLAPGNSAIRAHLAEAERAGS